MRSAWCPRCEAVLPLGAFQRGSFGKRDAYCRTCRYSYHLQRKHGLARAEADRLVAIDRCDACNAPPAPDERLHVDHDHATGEIRGVLCRWCNYAVAVLEDARLTQVQAYLYVGEGARRLRLVEGG